MKMAFFRDGGACIKCGEPIGLTEATYQTLRRSGATFYCAFGHGQVYVLGPSEADKLRQERDRLKQRTAQLEDEARIAWNTAEAERRRAAAARGQVTRLKNRAAAGVCPCCNRTFQNLQRHMTTKHAGFLAEEVQAEVGVTIQ